MKIDKRIYGYIEHELYHYKQYKIDLKLERERILESSSNGTDGQPRGNRISNIPLDKTIRLNESTAILSLERSILAVDNALKRLSVMHTILFNKIYYEDRKDVYSMCDELHISERTFQRFKSQLIYSVGKELGVIKKLA